MRNSHHPTLTVEINMGSDSYKECGLESTEEMGGIHNYQLYNKVCIGQTLRGVCMGGNCAFLFFLGYAQIHEFKLFTLLTILNS